LPTLRASYFCLYFCLPYDVLNQRYIFKLDKANRMRRLLRLAIGQRSQLCPVEAGFRLVVVVESEHAYTVSTTTVEVTATIRPP